MNITAEDKWTDWTRQQNTSNSGIDFTIENPNGATVTIQRKVQGLVSDEGSYTAATSTNFIAAGTTEYRVGVKTGNFGTAAFNVSIGG